MKTAKDVMLDVVKNLAVAFPGSKRTEDDLKRMAFVYHDALREQTGDAVEWAAKQAIREEKFFPKASQLLELCRRHSEHERKKNLDQVAGGIHDALVCPSCQTRALWVERWRPAIERSANGAYDASAWLVSADGAWLLLERYERLLCGCAAASLYTPAIGIEPAAIRVTSVGYTVATYRRTDVAIQAVA